MEGSENSLRCIALRCFVLFWLSLSLRCQPKKYADLEGLFPCSPRFTVSEVGNTWATLVDTILGRYRRLTLHRPHQSNVSSYYALALDDIVGRGLRSHRYRYPLCRQCFPNPGARKSLEKTSATYVSSSTGNNI